MLDDAVMYAGLKVGVLWSMATGGGEREKEWSTYNVRSLRAGY